MTRAEKQEALEAPPTALTPPPKRWRRGAPFVVVVGPDGVGKTAVARALSEQYHCRTAYFHLRPPIGDELPTGPPATSVPPPDKGSPHGSMLLGWIRLARNVVRFWAGYLSSVRPALRQGTMVIADRWAFGYVVQPHALKFYGPRALACWAIRALPRPDLVINLTAPPEVVRARKQELTLDQIRKELSEWLTLPDPTLRTFEALESPDTIAKRVLQTLAE